MTDAHPLARRIGHLIRMEREKKELTQATFARRLGIDQAAISRLECGRNGVTTIVVERALAALGYQLTIDIEPIDSALDAAIATNTGLSTEDRISVADRFRFQLGKLGTIDLDYRLAGAFGAFLQGVPIEARDLDLAITTDGADAFSAWLGRIPAVLRWSERHRDFTDYGRDPRGPGPARWGTPRGEIRAVMLDSLPEPVVIRLDDVDYPVLPLPLIAALDAQVARVVDWLKRC